MIDNNDSMLAPSLEPSLEPTYQSQPDSPVVIVGAGLSGLVAAGQLVAHGTAVVLLDKGRSAGGRLATRRLGLTPTARADSGAQFFTVRSPDFANLVHDWRRAGIVTEWCRGFATANDKPGVVDGHPRYAAVGGMNTIAKYLASSLDVETEVTVSSISHDDGVWKVEASDGRQWSSQTVLLSAPVPQGLALLNAGGVALTDATRQSLELVKYAKCFALLLELDRATSIPEPGGVQLSELVDPVFSFVADNHQKQISDRYTVTLHTHERVSDEHWDNDRDATKQFLIEAARRWLGDAVIRESYLHGWKFSRPTVGCESPFLLETLPDGCRLGFIGDAFGGAKIEGAALSGLAIADALIS